jgi:hypothetical protein
MNKLSEAPTEEQPDAAEQTESPEVAAVRNAIRTRFQSIGNSIGIEMLGKVAVLSGVTVGSHYDKQRVQEVAMKAVDGKTVEQIDAGGIEVS